MSWPPAGGNQRGVWCGTAIGVLLVGPESPTGVRYTPARGCFVRQNELAARATAFVFCRRRRCRPIASQKMQRAFRPIAAQLVHGLLILAGSCWAGPVQEGQTIDGVDQAPTLGLAASAAAPAALANADPAASASALAAEIIKEAGAGSHLAKPPQDAKASAHGQLAPSAAGKRPGPGSDEDDLNLREVGKAAIQWAKSSLPLLDGDADTSEAGQRAVEAEGTDGAPIVVIDTSDAKAATRGRMNAEENIVRVAVHFIREVVAHPMTWLVVSLVVIGGIVAKKIDRRPTE